MIGLTKNENTLALKPIQVRARNLSHRGKGDSPNRRLRAHCESMDG
jgi:hypothetical protein